MRHAEGGEMDDVYNDLETEKEHTAFLEELLKTLYGPGWDELTLFDAKEWHKLHFGDDFL